MNTSEAHRTFGTPEYSDKELKLFDYFGFRDLAEKCTSLSVVPLYRMCLEKAFIEDMKGPEVEALRRAAKALIMDASPYRRTQEFEALLEGV